jgi:hypothetical protein
MHNILSPRACYALTPAVTAVIISVSDVYTIFEELINVFILFVYNFSVSVYNIFKSEYE